MRANPPLIPPPVLVLLLLVFSACLTAFIPSNPLAIPFSGVIGALFVAAGLVVGASGFATFRKAGTPVRPGDEPTQLVTNGPFRVTRNPMYFGFELVLIGAFFLTKSAFFLIPPVVFFLLINFVQIPFEENLMAERFGQRYSEYRRRVRRWL